MNETPREISNGGTNPPSHQNVTPPFKKEELRRWYLRREFKIGVGVLLALGVVCVLIFVLLPTKRGIPQVGTEEVYMLVRDKVSTSAAVPISLPAGATLTPEEAKTKVSFDPPINGKWAMGSSPTELLFEPAKKLEQASHYTVTLALPEGTLSKDFLVDEDPKILAVFPREQSEAPEFSEITIVFNRPMVPLTILSELDAKDVPVTITPATEGKFKWITTRNLQFIPAKRLVRSANYTVTVKSGLTSMDGLQVAGLTRTFTTRPLRYDGELSGPSVPPLPGGENLPELSLAPDGSLVQVQQMVPSISPVQIVNHPRTLQHEPVLLQFNQPVDLERTRSAISVRTGDNTNRAVPVIAEYGTRVVRDDTSGKDTTYTDKSVIAVYGAKDQFGRARFFDFNTSYLLSITKALPLEGDIMLNEGRTVSFAVPEVIASVTAQSERSTKVSPDIFDPQGKLWITFYEPINKDASTIKAPNLLDIQYGEQCKEDENGYRAYGGNCDKEPDKTKISLTFKADKFQSGEAIPVEFRKLVNTDGVSLLSETVTKTATVFPALQILRTDPATGAKGTKLTGLTFCTNTPLKEPTEEEFYSKFKSTTSFGKWNWNGSYLVTQPYKDDPCLSGEFETTLRYGLTPETHYEIVMMLEDDFGAKAAKTVTLDSGKVDGMYRRLSHLQKAYNVTSSERTKLAYTAENLEYVNLNICQVSAETMLKYIDMQARPSPTTAGENLGCVKSITRKVELPKRYWNVNFFQVDLKEYVPTPLGHYIISLGHPDYRQSVYNRDTGRQEAGVLVYERTFLTVTNLAVQEKRIENGDEWSKDEYPSLTDTAQKAKGGNLYWVSTFGTLAPVSGARVDLYRKGGAWAVGGQTDQQGIARTPVAPKVVSAVVSYGTDSAIVSSQLDKFQWASSLTSARKTYIYTDRPIYRPSEEVFIKGLYRIGYDGEYEILRDQKAHVEVFDSRGQSVHTEDVAIGEYGTFTLKMDLAKSAPLGTYRVQALGGYGYFDVEEYVPASFSVDVTSPKEEYIAGDKLSLNVDSAYYFGVPVEAGSEVSYSILAQDYHFDRSTDGSGYFEFGRGWYSSPYSGYGDRFILRNKTALNAAGKATIEESLDFATFFKDADEQSQSKIFTINVSVKNKEGQTISAQKSVIVHRGAFYLGGNLERRYFGKNDANKILVKSVDTAGKPVGVSGITATISKVTWESFKRQEVDGRFYSRSEEKKTEVQSFTLGTDAKGDGVKDFSVKDEGEYELLLKAEDKDNNPIVSAVRFYVYGSGAVSVRPTNNETLDISVDRNTLSVGESAEVIVKSPFEKGKALITIERGRIFEYKVIDVAQNLLHFSVPMTEEYIPNVYLSIILLSPRPEVKFGQINFQISAKEKELTVSVVSEKKSYLPGEKVKLLIDVKNSKGQPEATELSVAVADLSVLALAGNPKKNPVAFFYGGLPLGVTTASNVKNILHEAEIPKGTKGGGGGDAEDLARKKRGSFKSTAFWQGSVVTNTQGHAEVIFTLPDNLTTWQSEAVGITKDTKVGVGYSELMARKEVMAVPLRPRFIIPGDTFKLGAKIFNESAETLRFNVKAESPTLAFPGATNAFIKVAPHESQTVYFDAKAPEVIEKGAHRFTISAESGNYLDSVEDSIAITRNDTYESVATAFSTSKDTAKEYIFLPPNVIPDKGALTINASATLSMYISDALQYLIAYPYGCSEQMASKLDAIAVLKHSLEAKNKGQQFKDMKVLYEGAKYSPDELVSIGLARITANQTPEGGFSYYQGLKADFYLTLHILDTLENLRRAGYAVDTKVMQNASAFLQSQYRADPTLRSDKDFQILLAYTLERLPADAGKSQMLQSTVVSIANTRKFLGDDASNLSLAYLSLVLSNGNYSLTLRDNVLGTLENRLTIDGRGAFLKAGKRNIYSYYETPIRDTALLVQAWVLAKKDHPLSDKVLRWILKSRSKDGAWGSTQNTLAVLDAFAGYTGWKQEANSSFDLSMLLDGKELAKFTFDAKNNESIQTKVLPVSDIALGKLHTIDFVKKNLNSLASTFYYDMGLTYFLPITAIAPRDEGFTISRELHRFDDKKAITPVSDAKVGEVLRGRITVTVPKDRKLVAVEGFIPAGVELVNFKLATEDQSLKDGGRAPMELATPSKGLLSGVLGSSDLPDEAYGPQIAHEKLYVDAEEMHDDRLFLFRENLPAGVYEYDYVVRALVPGTFQMLPAVVSELYFPENFGRTGGGLFTVTQ